jgi:general secretion pathway protein A
VQFAQRVAAEFHLPGMSRRGGARLYRAPAAVAGATREIFTPAACECVHLASRGIPRLVNQICDYALVYAYTDGLDRLTRRDRAGRQRTGACMVICDGV